jgi:hypothetical protein
MGPPAPKAGLWIGAIPDVAAGVALDLAMDLNDPAVAQLAHHNGPRLLSVRVAHIASDPIK